MDGINKFVDTIIKAIDERQNKKPKGYSTQAEVIRVQNGTAWVHIPGGADETPVQETIACKKGDTVEVRVENGTATLTGNRTAPPTDDQTANEAKVEAIKATKNAKAAVKTADDIAVKTESTIQTDTLHYLATSASSGVTRSTPGWTTTVQSITSSKRYLWTYHTYTLLNGNTVNTDPIITGVYGQKGDTGDDGTILLGSLLRTIYTESTWRTVSVTGYTDTYTNGDNGDTSGGVKIPLPIKAGNFFMLTGTAVDTGSSWEVLMKVTQDVTSGLEIPAETQSYSYGAPGSGAPGVSVTDVQPQYNLSTSTSSADGQWGTSLTYVSGYYIWTREKITYSDGNIGYSTALYDEALTMACSLSYDTAQYFWSKTTGGTTACPTGTYQTETPQSQYDDAMGGTPSGGAVLVRSDGLYLREGANTLLKLLMAGLSIYEPTDSTNPTAQYLQGSTIIGKETSENLVLSGNTMKLRNAQTILSEFSSSGMVINFANNYKTWVGLGGINFFKGSSVLGEVTSNGSTTTPTLTVGIGENGSPSSRARTVITGDYSNPANCVIDSVAGDTSTYMEHKVTSSESGYYTYLSGTLQRQFRIRFDSGYKIETDMPMFTAGITNTGSISTTTNVSASGLVKAQNVHEAMTAVISAYTSLSSTYKKVTLEQGVKVGSNLSISSGGVKCAKAGNVLISSRTQFINISDQLACRVELRNGTSTAVAYAATRASSNSTEVVAPPKLISVSANDVIYMYVSVNGTTSGTVGENPLTDTDKLRIYLTVQYV